MTSILIKNGYIVTPRGPTFQVIKNGALVTQDDKIVAVGPTKKVVKEYQADISIDATGKAVLPGLIDAHIHSPLSLLRGLAQDVAETEWMHKTVDPFSKHFTNELAIIGSRLTVVEALKAGTTCFCDYGAYMSDLVQHVYKDIGVRANVCSTINELGLQKREAGKLYEFDRDIGEAKLKENLDLVEKWHGELDGRITCLFGPQAADMISKEFLVDIYDIAVERGLSIHMHIAQGGRERKQMTMRYGKSTVALLKDLDLLGPHLIAVHCHDASLEELRFLSNSGATMVGCPGSIGMIDGIAPPIHDYLLSGGIASIGTDQCPPTGHNMFLQLKYASILNKTKHQDPTVLPTSTVLRLPTINAAKCHGLESSIGSLEPGKKADVILLDIDRGHLVPLLQKPIRNIIPNIVLHATGSEVSTVIVDGKIIMEDREIKTIDERTVLKEAQSAAERLAERAEKDFIDADSTLVRLMKSGSL